MILLPMANGPGSASSTRLFSILARIYLNFGRGFLQSSYKTRVNAKDALNFNSFEADARSLSTCLVRCGNDGVCYIHRGVVLSCSKADFG